MKAAPVMTRTQHRQTWRQRVSHALAARSRTYRSRSLSWRLLAPAVFVLAGGLFVTSAVSSGGTDLRAGRYDDLAGLVNAEAEDVEQLRDHAADLTEEVNRLSDDLAEGEASGAVQKAQADVDDLRGPAGLNPVQGPAVTVTLTDAPEAIRNTYEGNREDLLVHQQDIQGVANALWAGGAEAMTIQGQRVVSTTGIKCVGNTVVLHDVPYAPPYVISAIGPTGQMLQAVADDPYIGVYLQIVDEYELGWDVEVETQVTMPGYDGTTELTYAHPAGDGAVDDDR
jgi:uncharacterized protein YlxW (UPF0749 family)